MSSPSTLPSFSGFTEKIFGPPGCGKTTALLRILGEEIASGTSVDRIAYLTFTKTAASEALERAGKTKSDWFCTIHSACFRLSGLHRRDVFGNEERDLMTKAGYRITGERQATLTEDGIPDEGYDAVLFALGLARNTDRPLEQIVAELGSQYAVVTPKNVVKVRTLYERIKREKGKLDYDDMLQFVVDNPRPLPIDVMILDETQDLTRLQWRAVHVLGAGAKRIYMAGDDDQSIYSFMGADEYGFLDHPCDRERFLEQSYRCSEAVGRYATRIIARVPRRREKAISWQNKPGDVRVVGSISPADVMRQGEQSVMYLVRHRAQALTASIELLEHGVPHEVRGKSLQCSARARGIRTYIMLQRGERLPKSEVAQMLEAMGDASNARHLRLDGSMTHVRSSDIAHIQTFDRPWIKAWGKTQRDRRNNAFLHKLIQSFGLEIIGHRPRINITTMHASKGREADVVFICSDCNTRASDNSTRRIPSEVRLAYVTLTRSKSKVILSRPDTPSFLTNLF